ncbi:MAG: cell division topological specificity factor MinE [Succinivibrionaceae bacterium]
MSWLSDLIFKKKEEAPARKNAKSRLQLVLIHDRESREGPDFLPQLKLDIIAAIKKYIPISDDQVQVAVSQKDDTSMMEVSVSLDPKYDDTVPEYKNKYDSEDAINNIKKYDNTDDKEEE